MAVLVRRLRQRLEADRLLCIGTSATMSSAGTAEDQQRTVAAVASMLFGTTVDETLGRATDPSQGLTASPAVELQMFALHTNPAIIHCEEP